MNPETQHPSDRFPVPPAVSTSVPAPTGYAPEAVAPEPAFGDPGFVEVSNALVSASCTGGRVGTPVTIAAGSFIEKFLFRLIVDITSEQLDYISKLSTQQRARFVAEDATVDELVTLGRIKRSQAVHALGLAEALRTVVTDAANAAATTLLECRFTNVETTVSCAGAALTGTGMVASATVAAGEVFSDVSTEDANAIATALATSRLTCRYGNEALTLTCGDIGYANVVDGVTRTDAPPGFVDGVVVLANGETLRWSVAIPANTVIAATQTDANTQARALAIGRLTPGRYPNRVGVSVECDRGTGDAAAAFVSIGTGSLQTGTQGSSVTIEANVLTGATTDEADAVARATATSLLRCRWRKVVTITNPCEPQTVLLHDTTLLNVGASAVEDAGLTAAFNAHTADLVDDITPEQAEELAVLVETSAVLGDFTAWDTAAGNPSSDVTAMRTNFLAVWAAMASAVDAPAATDFIRERLGIRTLADTQSSTRVIENLGDVEFFSDISYADVVAQAAAAVDANFSCRYCNKDIPAMRVGTPLETPAVAAGTFCAETYAEAVRLAEETAFRPLSRVVEPFRVFNPPQGPFTESGYTLGAGKLAGRDSGIGAGAPMDLTPNASDFVIENSTFYLLTSRRPEHPGVEDWLTRAVANGGTGSASALVRAEMSKLYYVLDDHGFRDRIIRWNLFVGPSFAHAITPIIVSTSLGGAVIGTATDVATSVTASDWNETGASRGIVGGSPKSLDTGVSLNDLGDNRLVGVYLTAYDNTAFNFPIGSGTAANTNTFGFSARDNFLVSYNTSGVSYSNQPRMDTAGLSIINSYKDFLSGMTLGVHWTTTNNPARAVANAVSIKVLAFNLASSASGHFSGRVSGYILGKNITARQLEELDKAWRACHLALGGPA